ncbi:hypothetical protein [Bacillus sp. 2205SS5-2]|uniref:hypothetical protein n=1 Tax=Bacillus sp. 2205SS5-2 TaxID=3109031 RepID=UPI003007D469
MDLVRKPRGKLRKKDLDAIRLSTFSHVISLIVNTSLRIRVLFMIVSFVAISSILIGMIPYNQAKEAVVHSMEQRLCRVVLSISDVAQNLMFLFVGDKE